MPCRQQYPDPVSRQEEDIDVCTEIGIRLATAIALRSDRT